MAEDLEHRKAPKPTTFIKGSISTQLYRLSKTGALFLSWICLGMFNEVIGPTLPVLKARVSANYEQMGRILASRSAGLFIGSLCSGIFIDRFTKKRDLVLCVSLILSGCAMIAAPYISSIWLMAILFHGLGHAHALQTTSGNPSLAILWADKSSGPFNVVHSGFSLGASFAPLIAEPFVYCRPAATLKNKSAILNDNTNFPANVSNSTVESRSINMTCESFIEVPYGIIGGCCMVAALCFFVYFVCFKLTPKPFIPNDAKTIRTILDPRLCEGDGKWFGIKMYLLIAIYYAFVSATERVFGTFIYSYTRESSLGLDDKQAAWLNTSFWISFTCGRVIASLLTQYITIHRMIFALLAGVSLTSLSLNVLHNNITGFWISTLLFGVLYSPLYPSGLGWVNRYLHVTSMLITVVNIGSASGAMLFQWLTGYIFQTYGPQTFLYVISINSFLLLIIFAVMHVVGVHQGDRFTQHITEVNEKEIEESEQLQKVNKI